MPYSDAKVLKPKEFMRPAPFASERRLWLAFHPGGWPETKESKRVMARGSDGNLRTLVAFGGAGALQFLG